MTPEQVYSLALTRLPGVGNVIAKSLWEQAGSATRLFNDESAWRGLSPVLFGKLRPLLSDKAWIDRIRLECEEAESQGIQLLSISDDAYPHRLKECHDAPMLLFVAGQTSVLNAPQTVAVIGTRQADRYGKDLTALILKELHRVVPHALIVSGLAYGIDIAAHRSALKEGFPTVAVLGHGLDRIYPATHIREARDMMRQGGVVSEYPLGSQPDRFNFVTRNRIIAGLCDVTIVIQSQQKGGALITARLAQNYNRLVGAVPGRITDSLSVGCNALIAENVAFPVLSGEEIARQAGWLPPLDVQQTAAKQARVEVPESLFPELEPIQKKIIDHLKQHEGATVDDLCFVSGLRVSDLAFELFALENQGLIEAAPGGIYFMKVMR